MVQKIHKQIVEIESQSDLAELRSSQPFVWVRSNSTLYRWDPDAAAYTPLVAGGITLYRAILSQAGSAAPVATVLENTLGAGVVWARSSAGVYTGTLADAFLSGKVFLFVGSNASLVRTSDDVITLTSLDASFTPADDVLDNTAVEAFLYP